MNSVVVMEQGVTPAQSCCPCCTNTLNLKSLRVSSGSAAGQSVSAHVSGMDGSDLVFSDIRPGPLAQLKADACVLALPNGQAAAYVNALDAQSPLPLWSI